MSLKSSCGAVQLHHRAMFARISSSSDESTRLEDDTGFRKGRSSSLVRGRWISFAFSSGTGLSRDPRGSPVPLPRLTGQVAPASLVQSHVGDAIGHAARFAG
jgi:hypothetical protein